MSEDTREPHSNAYEIAHMPRRARKRQTGDTLFTVGALLFVFAWILILFVPSDIRSGHDFWTVLFAGDVVLAIALMIVGYRMRERMKLRASAEIENSYDPGNRRAA